MLSLLKESQASHVQSIDLKSSSCPKATSELQGSSRVHEALCAAEQGAGWDRLLRPPGPAGTHQIGSAREERPASPTREGREGKDVWSINFLGAD